MGLLNLLSILVYALGSGIALCALVWVLGDMFWDYRWATTWSGFFLIGLLASLLFVRYFYVRCKRETACSKCGAGWRTLKSRREDIRTYKENKESETKVIEYWQYWKCDNCGHESRHIEREYNTDEVTF